MRGYVWAYLFIFLLENQVVKNQKFAVDNNVQTSQVNNSIVFLCMGRWNSLVHLKIFTRYASQFSRGQFIQSPECFLFFPCIPSGCTATAAGKSLQSCPTLCDHIDGSPPGSSVSGILQAQSCLILCNPLDCNLPGSSVHEIPQARILEWVATSFSGGSSWPRDWTPASWVAGRLFTI